MASGPRPHRLYPLCTTGSRTVVGVVCVREESPLCVCLRWRKMLAQTRR